MPKPRFEMESSAIVAGKGTPVASHDHKLLACPVEECLEVRRLPNLRLLRRMPWPLKSATIKWGHPEVVDKSSEEVPGRNSRYILAFTGDEVRVWDLEESSWSAQLKNDGNSGNIVNAEFGRREDEVLTQFEFGSRITVWSVITRQSVELRDPKILSRPYSYRRTTGQLALLSRPAAQDILTLHQLDTYAILATTPLSSIDAQGLKWSPDCHWLAIWDAASAGQSVHIHTSDGRLYRTWTSDMVDENDGIGTKTLEWSPRGDYLAVGSYQRRVTLLGTKTFSPSVYLDHTSAIDLEGNGTAWQENISGSLERTYASLSQPFELPAVSDFNADKTSKTGITKIAFNESGTLIATKDEAAPTTVWIWNVATLRLVSVIIHHAPVRNLLWHPTLGEWLLIHCESDDKPTIHLWNAETTKPSAFTVSDIQSRKADVSWLTGQNDVLMVLVRSAKASQVVWPHGRGETCDGADTSYDSVYEALVGPGSADDTVFPGNDNDTFHDQRIRKGLASTNNSKDFGESDFF